MKIIFNSDLLFVHHLVKENLPKHLLDFFKKCKDDDHEIILPLTTVLEFDKKQEEFYEKEKSEVQNATIKLKSNGIEVNDFDIDSIIQKPTLVNILTDLSVKFKVEEPTFEDFKNAHQKACLHEIPHPPKKESDEMRDLVIWETAIRISKVDGPAILMSRDEVHFHHRGDSIAADHSLIRCDSLERAYESLDIETRGSKIVKEKLTEKWNDILSSSLPLKEGAHIISIKKPRFVNKMNGVINSKSTAQIQTGDGKVLKFNLEIEFSPDKFYTMNISKLLLAELKRHDEIKTLEFKPINHIVSDIPDPLTLNFSPVPSDSQEIQNKINHLNYLLGG